MLKLIIAAAVAANSFNLECRGQRSVGGREVYDVLEPRGSFKRRFRDDLDANRYCVDECTTTAPLHSVDFNLITFRLEDDSKGTDVVEAVNRETGTYTRRLRFPQDMIADRGTCVRTRFTGLPQRKF